MVMNNDNEQIPLQAFGEGGRSKYAKVIRMTSENVLRFVSPHIEYTLLNMFPVAK